MAIAAVLLLALTAVSLCISAKRRPPAPEMRTEIVTPETTDPVSIALSPDGRQIVFVASGDGTARLWLRRLDSTSARRCPAPRARAIPFWSPDSRSVGFFAEGKLKRMTSGADHRRPWPRP